VQVIVFSEIIYIARCVFGQGILSVKGILIAAIPCNYFVVLYSVLYIISPLINFSMEKISMKYRQRTLILFFVIFSILPSAVDVMNSIRGGNWNGLSTIGLHGSQWGYTIVNFTLMYYIGAYLRNNELKIKVSMIIAGQILLIALMSVIALEFNEDVAWSYCSPLVIVEAVLFMLLFLKMNIGVNRIINSLAKASFTCFLAHSVFLKFIGISNFATGNPMVLISHLLLTGILIFIVCWGINIVYSFIFSFVWNKIDKQIFRLKYEDKEA
jgi:surface polysaccharide O-acyltransferase-like enzyme